MLNISLISAILTDCQYLTAFATILNMPSVNPKVMNEIKTLCCNGIVTGVVCSSGVITQIDWGAFGLNGTISNNFPPQLTYLDLSNNQIKSPLPPSGYPDTLNFINLSNNQFNGTFPQLNDGIDTVFATFNKFTLMPTLPKNITRFEAGHNIFQQPFPSDLPKKLSILQLETCQFTGNVTNLPDSLTVFGICGSQLTGIIPKLPTNMNTFWACQNKLTGVTYPFPDTLTNINLYDNLIKSPIFFPPNINKFLANRNQFYGSLSPFPPSLNEIDLRDNELSGDISNFTYYHMQLGAASPLNKLQLQTNKFSGEIPRFPLNLIILNLAELSVRGSISLNQPTYLNIANTRISNITIQDPSLLNPSVCLFSNTPTLNNTNVEKLFPYCTHLNLYLEAPIAVQTTIQETTSLQDASIITRVFRFTSILATKSILKTSLSFKSTKTILYSQTNTIQHYEFHKQPVEFTMTLLMIIRISISLTVFMNIFRFIPWRRDKTKLASQFSTRSKNTNNSHAI
eukprot:NODE_117_length_18329_cov_0.420954.p2 type:complete len:512 gc:universal NODE_117_length_18329_cov_0.420954:1531-3066(+)